MGKIVRILLLLVSLPMLSQVKSKRIVVDTIAFSIDYRKYQKVGLDSVRSIYHNQEKRIKAGGFVNQYDAISRLFELKDIQCVSIPTFKLKKGDQPFGLKSCIEDYIDFNQDFRFQQVFLYKDDVAINYVQIPDFKFELSRIHQGRVPYVFNKKDYENNVLQSFIDAKNALAIKKINARLKSSPENTFFTIFGLNGLLFEIDKQTGLLYVSITGPGSSRDKELANDYLLKYAGIEQINDMINGMYVSDKLYEGSKKCPKKRRKVVFKIN
ncbi:hypothetical protein NAT51_13020 [Flavobacterium amniphilum]|uniref:hypothetical protein n=1 Tax=Flavobacterium amniphilum TaxID=1834035 RepID=UPI00202A4CFF|nr:hypothetical protein [Flavobacterium amniphilum]MCL9806452.1 hypothetical protein [Flavobacterium amniphilum]